MKEVMPPNANTPPVSLKLHIDRGIDVALNIIIIGLLMTAQLSFDLPRKLPLIEQQLQVQVEGPLIVESSLVESSATGRQCIAVIKTRSKRRDTGLNKLHFSSYIPFSVAI